ncbi:hypothetical protein [Empedobacter brevis]|uniref:hypothetical protein n=1 Tax=Empedobacter brevis TaxID=247 RepID=UPI0028975653|nr:hypothetical protein [Empedobacter brevis]
MKNIFFSFIILGTASIATAQVAIGKENVVGTSTLLDFESNFRGIILPAVSMSNVPALNENNNGTFLFDLESQTVQMFENEIWIPLSDEGNAAAIIVNSTDEDGKGVIIGAENTSALGALVLEASDKAMILPKVADPHLTVKSPYPGMICYDTSSKTMAVFDGSVWNYWK